MKSFFHFLKHNPCYALINVFGLAVSLMFVILIGDYTWRQYSVDSWNRNRDRIYLMGNNRNFMSWPDISEQIASTYPEINSICRVVSQAGVLKTGEKRVGDGQSGDNILIADSNFMDFFDLPILEGDKSSALDSPGKCMITKSLADRLFPDENPLGKELSVVGQRSVIRTKKADPYDSTAIYTVSAVLKDFDRTVLPNETEAVFNLKDHPKILGYLCDNNVFVATSHGVLKTFLMTDDISSLRSKSDEIAKLVKDNTASAFNGAENQNIIFTPFSELMFAKQNDGGGLENGDKGLLSILLSAIIAILLFAVTNYVNLTVANTGLRAKEMATRRLLGSTKVEVIRQLVYESVLMVSLSFIIGLVAAFALQDDIASLFRGKIALDKDISFGTVSVCLLFVLLTGFVSGIVPGLQISRFKPIDVVKGSFRYKSKMVFSRVSLVIQNVITVVMLSASLIMFLQIGHLVDAPLGYETKGVVEVSPWNDSYASVLRDELLRLPSVSAIGEFSGSSPCGSPAYLTASVGKDGERVMLYYSDMDRTAAQIYGFDVLSDYGNAPGSYYLTEDAVRLLCQDKNSRTYMWGQEEVGIAGVIGDLHMSSILRNPDPVRVGIRDLDQLEDVSLVVKTDGSSRAYKEIVDTYTRICGPSEDIEYDVRDLHEFVNESFSSQRNTLKIVLMFTLVAIVISILGFIGMSLFFARQRRKEIGVRKIMGSSVSAVIALMLRKFCSPLIISMVVAVPIAIVVMRGWMESYSYRINLSPWIFIATCLASLLMAILSIIIQITRAALINPRDCIVEE